MTNTLETSEPFIAQPPGRTVTEIMAPQKKFVSKMYVAPSRKTKKPKRSKDTDAPKRPMTAYFLFMGEKRAKVKNANPDFTVGDISKELGKMWANIGVAEKERFEKKAAMLKEVYAKKKAASPKRRKKKSASAKKKVIKKGSKRPRLGAPEDGYEADTEDSDLD